ncbi:hypothetical protein AN221_03530 [Streptomyces nanshensis]|uniref:Uncharacterized protein n=1 Tax=Streptomyces nanshensis TaxID=518642 RepID=A0A1E7M0V8_9ACTN|nr:hypothetical protein AN221_03530 [Streptomyces nanshensis]
MGGEDTDVARLFGELLAEVSVLGHGLMECPDEGLVVFPETAKFFGVGCAEFFELPDLLAQAFLAVRRFPAGADFFVELVLQVRMALGQSVAGHLGFRGQGDDGQCPV